MTIDKIKSINELEEMTYRKYVLYNSNDEIEITSNNKIDFVVSVRTVIINYIAYCMDCNRDNLENLNHWIDELEHLQYNSYNTLEDYKPLFEDYGFKLIIK